MVYYLYIAFWVSVGQLVPKSVLGTKNISFCYLWLMFALMATVVFLNPITGDMELYLDVLDINSNLNWFGAISNVRWEPGFVSYQWLLAQFTTSHIVFIGISMFVMWAILISALKKVVAVKYLPLLMFGYLSLFCFYNFSMNVVRQGFAAPLIILMLVYLGNNKYRKAIVIFLTALTFHQSSIIAGPLLVIKRLNVSVRFLCVIFAVSSLLMITGLNQRLMSDVAVVFGGGLGDAVISYSSEAILSRYGSSNRIDFLIFTSTWILWGLWFRSRYLSSDEFYVWLLKCYIALSSVYILFGFIGYSDRLAAYAWFLIPILMFYPAIKMQSKYRKHWILVCMIISVVLFMYFDVFSLYKPLKLFY
ncbi:EpsG family protein [Peribacillus sp. FSL K6-1552]|uniref:EpsG family protein n=1 Tax=Peribacillus sp. FSL K6-1552 TaxID=2954514 RepID=UPI0030FC6671